MKRIATAAVLLAALAALSACSSDDNDDAAPAKTTSPGADAPARTTSPSAAAEKQGGIPPEPTGDARTELIAALFDVDPALVADEADAIDNARNQCSAINGGAEHLDRLAAQRFSGGDVKVTEEQGKHINIAIGDYCKTA